MVADILHDWPIDVPIDRVFESVSTSAGLDAWWTETSKGVPREGHEYELGFGPEFYRVSCNCWAMYLRILRRYLEHGEIVPYDVRLDV